MKHFFSTLPTQSGLALAYTFSSFSLFSALALATFPNFLNYTNDSYAGVEFALGFLASRFLAALFLAYVKPFGK